MQPTSDTNLELSHPVSAANFTPATSRNRARALASANADPPVIDMRAVYPNGCKQFQAELVALTNDNNRLLGKVDEYGDIEKELVDMKKKLGEAEKKVAKAEAETLIAKKNYDTQFDAWVDEYTKAERLERELKKMKAAGLNIGDLKRKDAELASLKEQNKKLKTTINGQITQMETRSRSRR